MVVEYGVVIRRQLAQGGFEWQFWTGAGAQKADRAFLAVMNHAGALGFEAVSAGHFDDLAVPEVLLQRRMPMPESAAPRAAGGGDAVESSSAKPVTAKVASPKAATPKIAAKAAAPGSAVKAPRRKGAPAAKD